VTTGRILIEMKECEPVKCDFGGKDYRIMKILSPVVPSKSNDPKETVMQIISFKMA